MKYRLFILTFFASIGFFNYHALLHEQVIKLLFYLNILICLAWSVKNGRSLSDVKYPRTALFMILSGFGISIIMATAFHSQSLFTSVMATLPFIFAYGSLYVWLKMDIPNEKIIKAFMVMGVLSTIVYFCNVLTMPFNIFGEPILNDDLSRGIIRVPVVYIEMFPLLVFYGINKFIDTKEKKWLIVIGVAFLMIILSVIRQIILLTAVIGLWFYFRRISFWKKAVFVAACVAFVALVLPQIPIYNAMIELSEDQRDQNDNVEDPRILAWRYYTYENQTNAITPILGNGIPSFGNSLWGKIMDSETEVNSTYAADVGWAGFYWFFGAFATAGLIILLVKAMLKKKKPSDQYLTCWLVYCVITSIASGIFIYYWQSMLMMIIIAMVYNQKSDETETQPIVAQKKDDKPLLNTYPQLKTRI